MQNAHSKISKYFEKRKKKSIPQFDLNDWVDTHDMYS